MLVELRFWIILFFLSLVGRSTFQTVQLDGSEIFRNIVEAPRGSHNHNYIGKSWLTS